MCQFAHLERPFSAASRNLSYMFLMEDKKNFSILVTFIDSGLTQISFTFLAIMIKISIITTDTQSPCKT